MGLAIFMMMFEMPFLFLFVDDSGQFLLFGVVQIAICRGFTVLKRVLSIDSGASILKGTATKLVSDLSVAC